MRVHCMQRTALLQHVAQATPKAHNLLEWWIYTTVESTPCRLSLVCYTIAHLLRLVVGLRKLVREPVMY